MKDSEDIFYSVGDLYKLTKYQANYNTKILEKDFSDFLKGQNSTMGDNSDKKKYGSANFSQGIYR